VSAGGPRYALCDQRNDVALIKEWLGVSASRCWRALLQLYTAHLKEKIGGADPQESDGDPRRARRTKRKYVRCPRDNRWHYILCIVHCGMHQHGEQEAAICSPVKPRHYNGQCSDTQKVYRERLARLVIARNEEER